MGGFRIDGGVEKSINRHIGKLLCNLSKMADIPPHAAKIVMKEMHWLAEDVEAAVKLNMNPKMENPEDGKQEHRR